MQADIAPLSAISPHAARWDVITALGVMALSSFLHFFSDPVRVAALVVMLITLWEKPTVQGWVTRLRAYLSERKR